jgi:hypothetical protein
MKTIINIGTNKKNIVGVEFDKPFIEITGRDILDEAKKHFKPSESYRVQGWALISETE